MTPCLGASLLVSSKDPFEKESGVVFGMLLFDICSCVRVGRCWAGWAVAGEEHVSGFLCCHCRDPGCGHRGGLRGEQAEGHQQ